MIGFIFSRDSTIELNVLAPPKSIKLLIKWKNKKNIIKMPVRDINIFLPIEEFKNVK